MKMKVIPALAVMLLFAAPAFAAGGTNVGASAAALTNVGVGVSSSPSASLVQNNAAVDPGTGRPFLFPVQPYQAQVLPYLGPWPASGGFNVLDDLRSLPEIITMSQAKTMYQGGVTARINKMEDNSYQFDTCKLLSSLPVKPLLGADGNPVLNPVLDKDGKPVYKDGKAVMAPAMAPDESKFRRVAYIFLKGNGEATTIDAIAKGCEVGMDAGANGILLLKKAPSTATHSTGGGVGFGGVSGQLGGAGQTSGFAASGGTGYHSATAEPEYHEGMALLAVQTDGGMSALRKNGLLKADGNSDSD